MKKISIICITIATLMALIVACVKDLEKEGICSETEIIGTVVEKSASTPLPDIKVSVTDGNRIHASATTSTDGSFRMKVNFSEVDENYYLLLDGSPDLPSKQEQLRGMGNEYYDYKMLVLYDKTDTNLLPQVSTGEASNVLGHTATVRGTVSFSGGKPLTGRGICYATHQTPTIDDTVSNAGSEVGTFNCNLTGLQTSTTYYYRAYATNSIGISYGEQKMFTTTEGLPTVTTTTPTNILATTAKSGGNVTADGGSPVTARGICWNTTGNPDLNDTHTTNGTGNGTFTANMTDLTPSTTYHVRAYATNSDGTSYGEEKTLTTTNGLPTVTISSNITNITATSAVLNGNVTNDNGSSITEKGFCWSTSQSPTISDSHINVGTGAETFSGSATNLTRITTYYVRAYATNNFGTSYSSQVSFQTTSGLPTVTISNEITDITATSAVLSGNVTSDNGYAITQKGFCWSTNQYPTINDNHINAGTGTGIYTSSATNLTRNTTYYVRAYATNIHGTSYSNDQRTFTTNNGLPMVTTTTPTLNGETVATGGNVTSDGGFAVTARGICYGTFPYPDLTNTYSHTTDGSGTGYYSSSFNLPDGSGMYYVRAYATNANGTTYGEQVTVIQPYDNLPTFEYNGHTYRVAPDPGESMLWSDANTYCNGLEFCGYSDWRLPSKDELYQMYIYSNSIGGFVLNRYWSGTRGSSSSTSYYWYCHFGDGTQNTSPIGTSKHRVRPIRIVE